MMLFFHELVGLQIFDRSDACSPQLFNLLNNRMTKVFYQHRVSVLTYSVLYDLDQVGGENRISVVLYSILKNHITVVKLIP